MIRTAETVHRRLVCLVLLLVAPSPGCAWFSKAFGSGDRVATASITLILDEKNWHEGDWDRSEGDDVDVVASRCADGSISLAIGTKHEGLSAEGTRLVIREFECGERTVRAQLWALYDFGPPFEHEWSGNQIVGRVWISEDKLTTGERARVDYALIGTGEHDLGSASARGAVTFVVP